MSNKSQSKEKNISFIFNLCLNYINIEDLFLNYINI